MDPREVPLPPQIGRYHIERLLGRGAMGRVFLGVDLVLDREVAVKLLRDDLLLEPEQRLALVDRMRQEAKACARVTHPNIVTLFDMGEDDTVGLYLVFEYAAGTTLKQRLARAPMPGLLVGRIAREIGSALSTAHASGVLHRDIKPENIILTEHGSKVADFGIARVPNSTLTRDGGLLGTPAYSAPECITHGEFSPYSDQFSLAATLYEALSQRRAFPGDDAVTVAKCIQTEDPPPIAAGCGLDPHVDGVLSRALSKDPAKRFASTSEFGDALAESLGQGMRGAMPTIPDAQHRAAFSDRPSGGMRNAMGGAAVGALLGITVFQLTTGLRDREREAAAVPVVSERHSTPPVAWLSPAPRERPRVSSPSGARARASAGPSATPAPSAVSPRGGEGRSGDADAGAPTGDAGP